MWTRSWWYLNTLERTKTWPMEPKRNNVTRETLLLLQRGYCASCIFLRLSLWSQMSFVSIWDLFLCKHVFLWGLLAMRNMSDLCLVHPYLVMYKLWFPNGIDLVRLEWAQDALMISDMGCGSLSCMKIPQHIWCMSLFGNSDAWQLKQFPKKVTQLSIWQSQSCLYVFHFIDSV